MEAQAEMLPGLPSETKPGEDKGALFSLGWPRTPSYDVPSRPPLLKTWSLLGMMIGEYEQLSVDDLVRWLAVSPCISWLSAITLLFILESGVWNYTLLSILT